MNDNQQDQNAKLIKILTELETRLSVQLGEFKFFALDTSDRAQNDCHLVAAADWIDANPGQAKEILLTALKPELSKLDDGLLSDVTPLPSSDPIVVSYRLKYADFVTEDGRVVEDPETDNSSPFRIIRCRPMS
jgi:hypothetical protein